MIIQPSTQIFTSPVKLQKNLELRSSFNDESRAQFNSNLKHNKVTFANNARSSSQADITNSSPRFLSKKIDDQISSPLYTERRMSKNYTQYVGSIPDLKKYMNINGNINCNLKPPITVSAKRQFKPPNDNKVFDSGLTSAGPFKLTKETVEDLDLENPRMALKLLQRKYNLKSFELPTLAALIHIRDSMKNERNEEKQRGFVFSKMSSHCGSYFGPYHPHIEIVTETGSPCIASEKKIEMNYEKKQTRFPHLKFNEQIMSSKSSRKIQIPFINTQEMNETNKKEQIEDSLFKFHNNNEQNSPVANLQKNASSIHRINSEEWKSDKSAKNNPLNIKFSKTKDYEKKNNDSGEMDTIIEKLYTQSDSKEDSLKRSSITSQYNFKIKRVPNIVSINSKMTEEDTSPAVDSSESKLCPRSINIAAIQEILEQESESTKQNDQLAYSQLEIFNRRRNIEGKDGGRDTIFADNGVEFFNYKPENVFRNFFENDNGLNPHKKTTIKKIEQHNEYTPVLAEFDENTAIIQPEFMKQTGTMCFTEIWSDKERKKYMRLMKEELQTVKIRDHQDLYALESLYKPDKIKETCEVMNKINSQNHAHRNEYIMLAKPEYKRHSIKVQLKDKQTKHEIKHDYISDLVSSENSPGLKSPNK